MWTCAGVLALITCACAITRDQFYPYGTGLDQRLPRGAEVSSPDVPLKVPIVFFGETYESIFVNNYGVLSFRAEIQPFLNSEFPLPYPSIAAFYTNIDTTETGAIYYRETNEPRVLLKAEESIQNNFNEYYGFQPTSVFIATWVEVTYSNPQGQTPKNSFQIAIISNGTESFVELLYPDREIQWIQRDAQPNLQEAKAQAGFIAEDGRIFTLRGSGSHQIRNIVTWSNTHEPGKYVFRVGNIPPDYTIAVPDQYNQNEVEIEEESKTCAQSGPSVCHIQARCVDYQAGICCQCNDGFYGNGKSCIKDDVPLRAHGKLNGVINKVSLNDVDIQSYVVVADGRSYTAISQAPQILGSSLQLLHVLGGIVGWLFAKPSGGAKNGYQLTGSVFNHSADVFFPSTGDRVTVTQEFIGHDVFDQIALDADVRGSLPVIPDGVKLEILEYEEQYSLVQPGLIHSESTRTFTNKFTGEKYEQRISQTITYNPCRFAPVSDEEAIPSLLKISKNYLGYEARDNIVRYGMANKLSLLTSDSGSEHSREDPCLQGQSSCGPHGTCTVQGDSFSCICQPGFTNIYQNDRPVCVDIDECAAGTHNCDTNADCFNHNGGFQCRCRGGFDGNGVSCTRVSQCGKNNCDSNAHCIESYMESPICVCNDGYTGNGQRCWPVQERYTCNDLQNCSPYGTCVYSSDYNNYKCECNVGYIGDGYNCLEDIVTTTASTVSEADYNSTFILPSCDENNCNCPPGYAPYRDEKEIDLCRLVQYEPPNHPNDNNDTAIKCTSDADCPPNALCYNKPWDNGENQQELGHCVCPDGYEGDAYECIEKTGPSCSCGPSAHCIDTATGEFICVCDAGYHGDGYICRPNFSCTNDTDCEYNAECRYDDASGEYVCQCVEGYRRDQNQACIPDRQLCNGAICSEYATCLYDASIGISYCACNPGYEGDGITQCAAQVASCDVLNNCSPNGVCVPTETSYQCVCNERFTGDGYTCTMEMTCQNVPSLCAPHATCLKRHEGYVCECNSGYSGNGEQCELNVRQAGNFLVVAGGIFIYRVPFQITPINYPTPINSNNVIAVGLDVDCLAGYTYWGDIINNTIKRTTYDGSDYGVFLENDINSPEGLAIDWSSRNIFWTDSKKLSIEVANMETRVRKVLFSREGINNPRGIAVHPEKGKIFWADWYRASPKIEWANMDGSQRGVFLDSSEVVLPNSLAIDFARDRLCYADAGLFAIKCVSMDCTMRNTCIQETIATNCTYPFGLAINGDRFYWTDWKTYKIEYIDYRTKERGQLSVSNTSTKSYGIAVAQDQCPGVSSVCQYRNGNCGPHQICLPDGRGSRTCVDGDGSYDTNRIF